MWRRTKSWTVLATLALVLVTVGCDIVDDDGDDTTGPDGDRVFRQIERLGNPLVSEVTFEKRDHGFHNTTPPDSDVVRGFRTRVEAFVNAFRPNATVGDIPLAEVISSVLVPDVLVVQTDRPRNTAAWLSWVEAFGDGYGGRELTDDVVDTALGAIFGDILTPTDAIPALSTDNVDSNDAAFLPAFPYLADPH